MFDRVSGVVALLSLLLASVLPGAVCAQSLYWSVDMNSVFDNREGDARHTEAKTFFQTQLAPEIGLELPGGGHRIAAGVVWTQPIGCEWDGYKLSPTVYYRYDSNRWKFSMGMFPRAQLLRPLPNYIWSDSVYYSQRNIRGALVQYEADNGFAEAVVDWRGMQTETRREAFNIIVQGEWQPEGPLRLGGLAMMNHLAKSKNPPDDEFVVDNFLVNPYVGLDLTRKLTALDSCSVRVGVLASMSRDRADDRWQTPAGVWVDVCAQWKWLGVKNTFYKGKPLFPYYGKFGAVLEQGEPFYASKYYNRTSVYAVIMNNSFMNLHASMDFNLAERDFTFYQRLILRVYIDSRCLFGKHKAPSGAKLPMLLP